MPYRPPGRWSDRYQTANRLVGEGHDDVDAVGASPRAANARLVFGGRAVLFIRSPGRASDRKVCALRPK